MNILIVNKYFFVSGGPERYLFSVSELLESRGHSVIPLSLRIDRNHPTPHDEDFLPSPFGEGTSHYQQVTPAILDRARMVARAIYYPAARDRVARIVERERIDVVYLLNICNYISPSVIDGAKEGGASVVMRLSDYNFVCSSYHFFRNGQVCTACQRGMYHALLYRCSRGSFAMTLARVVAMKYHQRSRIYHDVDAFVAPSRIMAEALLRFGLSGQRVHYIPSFVDLERYHPSFEPGKYVLYFGRLAPEKGVGTLLQAWNELGPDAPPLRIVGSGRAEAELKARSKALALTNVEFHGFVEQAEVAEMIRGAAFIVVPSLGLDNSPIAVYEAMACGKAVVASRLGGIVDQVEDGVTGFLLAPHQPHVWARAIRQLWANPALIRRFGHAARRRMETVFTASSHLTALETIFRHCSS